MKKIISLILALIMLLSLASCSKVSEFTDETEEITTTEEKEEPKKKEKEEPFPGEFAVGISWQDYTPTAPTPLGGFAAPQYRLSKTVKNNVGATCLAMKDKKGNIALTYTLDLLSISDTVSKNGKLFVSNLTKVPQDNINFCCTHTHEAPSTSTTQVDATNIWLKAFYKAIKTAATEAIANLDKAEIYENTINVPNLNFVRRFKSSTGKYLSSGDSKATAIAYETEVDDALQVIKFDRANQKDIVLVNWRAHPCHDDGEKATVISADYIHYMREYVKKQGYECAFWQGAAGNVICNSALPAMENEVWAKRDVVVYGEDLGKSVISALNGVKKVNAGEIKIKVQNVTLNVDHSRDALASKGKEVSDLVNANKTSEARALAAKYGFASMYDATAVYSKSQMAKTRDMTVAALSCGDIAFIFAPYEMFDMNGMDIRERSPFKHTFICELTNSSWSYFPAKQCIDHGGYEVCQFRYVKGTSEQLADAFVSMLKEIY